MKLIFFGTPEFAVLSLKTILESEHEVLAVVTQPDKRSGRGGRMVFCPIKLEAEKTGLRILQPHNIRDRGFIEELKALNPSAIVVVAYGQILPPEIIHLPGFGCINVHASLLPKFRGAAPINWAIIIGEKKTGITTMLMDEGMDTGPILLQDETDIKEDDTAGSLSQRLSKIGAGVLMRTLRGLDNGSIRPRPQTGNATYARALKKTDGHISWSKPAVELCSFIRGMTPWPGVYGFLGRERVKILKAVHREGNGKAGVIQKVTRDGLLIGTGRGLLSILEIQPSGKPVMAIKAFLQGRRLSEGMRFHEKPVD